MNELLPWLTGLAGIVIGAVGAWWLLKSRFRQAAQMAQTAADAQTGILKERLDGRERELAELRRAVEQHTSENTRLEGELRTQSEARAAAEARNARLPALEAELGQRDAELLRQLKPRFNRAGVWPGRPRYVAWRFIGQTLELSLHDTLPAEWEGVATRTGHAPRLLGSVLRLLWLAHHPAAGFSRLPCGWAHNRFDLPVTLPCGAQQPDLQQALGELLRGSTGPSGTRWRALLPNNLAAFDQAALSADLEELESFTARVAARLHCP